MIFEEFDKNKSAIINAFDIIKPIEDFPKIAVSCFARATFSRLVKELKVVKITSTSIANMEIPVYKANYKGIEVALFMSYVRAPGCVALIEDIFAMGAEKRDKVNRRKAQGCICVDMECSAIAALSKFRERDSSLFLCSR